MNKKDLNILRCPATHGQLSINQVDKEIDDNILEGSVRNEQGNLYFINDGIVDFLLLDDEERNKYALDLFKDKASTYDDHQHLSFETFYKKEDDVRNSLINKLCINDDSTVLEVNAGTGRDSVLISKRLSKLGNLHVQDISAEMLKYCKDKLQNSGVPFSIHRGNASILPYENKIFDAVYSFGGVGMNVYADNKKVLRELVRVTKIGGRIVIGGLSLAPWLRETTFGKILINHNPHYANNILLADFPVEARELNLSWILNGAGFVIDFIVDESEPEANFEYEIPGPRGGTHLTRFYGQLEGVTPATKKLAIEAREKLGISMHKWLDELIESEAKKILNR
jgi:ubiquinone/menaquinone biosynthesis C-methylase UbiE